MLQRIVIRAPNWLGDIVMAMPAFAAIRRHFPEARLAIAAPAPFEAFCRAVPGIDDVVALRGGGLRGLGARAASLESGRFDVAVLLTNSFVTAVEAWRAGIGERWGVRRDFRGALLTRGVARPGRRRVGAQGGEGDAPRDSTPAGMVGGIPSTHHARYYLRIVDALGIGGAAAFSPLAVGDVVRDDARGALVGFGWTPSQPLVALAPGAAYGGAKRWPATHAADAIIRLHAQGVRTVLVGAAADRDAARAIESALVAAGGKAAQPLDLVGQTDLARLMGVFSWCRVVLANDSGAMHVASAVGRPVVAVFGPTDESATAPLGPHTIVRHDVWCRPCLLRECPLDHACMQGISGQRVVDAATAWLVQEEETA